MSTKPVLVAAACLAVVGLGLATANAVSALAPPLAPGEPELSAGYDSSITVEWEPVAGATRYNIYRGTSAGGQGSTPIATTTATEYRDSNLSPTPIYFYRITAVNADGESPRSPEHASKTPPPTGTGGNIPGAQSGNSLVFYCKDALRGGFDWFQTLTGWFPSVLGSSGSISPDKRVVDMAYADEGSMTFNNVVVPAAGLYTVDWRYAFQGGLFPGVNNRQMGLVVNGTVITRSQSFPITGSFDTYWNSFLQVQLRAGVNSISMIAVSDHGVPRVDQMTVTPATASVPSGPGNLRATAGNASVTLNWTASGSGSPTSYRVYRGTKSDGEQNTPVGTVTGTTFTDTGLRNGTQYFYFVQAYNSVGGSPLSNEVSTTPSATGPNPTPTATPAGLLSQGRPVTASSVENTGRAAANAVDGNTGTRWSSAFSDPQWIQVDLGASRTVNRVLLNWEAAYGRAYQIQTSPDGSSWTTVYSTTTGNGGLDDLAVSGTARYVRMHGTQRATGYGYSLWEFQVFGM